MTMSTLNTKAITVCEATGSLVVESSDLGLKGWPKTLTLTVPALKERQPRHFTWSHNDMSGDDLAGAVYVDRTDMTELLIIND